MSKEAFPDRFIVVLVEPEDSLNIGAVARAMMNLGFRQLRLVAPVDYDRYRAGKTARRAEPLLDAVPIYATLREAVADCDEVVGLSLRPGRTPAHFATLPEWATTLPVACGRKAALVFGPEANGLRQEHLSHCRWIVRIPSDEEFTAFNLAQSVLLVLYEITRTLTETGSANVVESRETPTWNDFSQLERLLEAVMNESGFVRPGTPAPIPDTVKTLFRRLEPSTAELRVLMALFARIERTLRRQKPGDS